MDRTRKVALRTKKFVHDHKVAIAVIVTATCCLTLQVVAMKDHNDFLKEKGLYDEFYTPTDEEM